MMYPMTKIVQLLGEKPDGIMTVYTDKTQPMIGPYLVVTTEDGYTIVIDGLHLGEEKYQATVYKPGTWGTDDQEPLCTMAFGPTTPFPSVQRFVRPADAAS
jgi:hypothetical protein